MVSEKEKQTVRELARKYMEAVNTERQEKMYQRFKDTNDLKLVRPPVLIDEIPWYQIDIEGELTCICEDQLARAAELQFRKGLYYIKHFKADNTLEPFFRINRAYDSTGIGVDIKKADVKRTDNQNHIARQLPRILSGDRESRLVLAP